MRLKFLALIAVVAGMACNNAAPVTSTNSNANRPINVRDQSNEAQTMIAHSTEDKTPPPANSNGGGGKWTQSGDPIDTSKFDAAIETAKKGSDKKALAEAYFERGFALTEARQYASALGDYRRALKQDPNHEESKKWIDQIVSIYAKLKKDPPKEGEEPPPLPFKKAV